MSNHTYTLSTRERDIIVKHLTAEREKLDEMANSDPDKYTRAEAFEDALDLTAILDILSK